MSADVARSHGGDGGGEDRPVHTMYPALAWVALLTEHLQKAYNANKAAFKAHHWVIDPTTGTYNVEKTRRAKSTAISRQGSRSLARIRDEMRQSSTTQEYPSLIDTFFVAHIVNWEFHRDEDRQEMRRLEATGTYTDDEINRLARGGKQRGHIPGVGRILPARATASLMCKTRTFTLGGRGLNPRPLACGNNLPK
nr:F-box domain, leucine-rich repeat domain, L domain-like protein [Tanacetum cinerariifolium]